MLNVFSLTDTVTSDTPIVNFIEFVAIVIVIYLWFFMRNRPK